MRKQTILAIVITILATSQGTRGVTLRWVGPSGLNPAIFTESVDMSADGKTILGRGTRIVNDRDTENFFFTWTDGVGTRLLDDPEGTTSVRAISPDGSVVVGRHEDQAAYWDDSGFHFLGLDTLRSSTQGVSQSGEVIIGSSTSGTYIWTQAGGMEPLPEDLTPHEISAEGTIVVGDLSPSASETGQLNAAYWSEATGIVTIDPLPGPTLGNSALGVSPDGSKIIGTSSTPVGFQAYMWSPSTGVTSLSSGLDEFRPTDVSDTGVVIGRARLGGIVQAAIWTEGGGLQHIVDYLREQGLNLAPDARLNFATGISRDGMVFSGWGGNLIRGEPDIWVADLLGIPIPEPSTIVLVAVALVGLTSYRIYLPRKRLFASTPSSGE